MHNVNTISYNNDQCFVSKILLNVEILNRSRDNFSRRAMASVGITRESVPSNEHRACLFNGKFGDAIKLEEGGETY